MQKTKERDDMFKENSISEEFDSTGLVLLKKSKKELTYPNMYELLK